MHLLPPVRARLGFHLFGWDGPHCLWVRTSLGPFGLEKQAPKTSHVGPALGNVAGVVRDHNFGHLVQRELPQAIHLLAILIASAVAVGGRFNALVGAARCCPCVEQEANKATRNRADANQAKMESGFVFMEPMSAGIDRKSTSLGVILNIGAFNFDPWLRPTNC